MSFLSARRPGIVTEPDRRGFRLERFAYRGEQARADGPEIDLRRQLSREVVHGTHRVGVAIEEPKDAWLRLFVAWIADDNVVEGINE